LALAGYSWHTNQKGLALDGIVAFQLVKPDGEVVKVTEQSDAELFGGAEGGLFVVSFRRQLTLT
jgi:hypothetical protein